MSCDIVDFVKLIQEMYIDYWEIKYEQHIETPNSFGLGTYGKTDEQHINYLLDGDPHW